MYIHFHLNCYNQNFHNQNKNHKKKSVIKEKFLHLAYLQIIFFKFINMIFQLYKEQISIYGHHISVTLKIVKFGHKVLS